MRLWQLLGYAGLLPFLTFITLSISNITFTNVSAEQGFIFYSVSILSFLSGTLWQKDRLVKNNHALVISNLFCLYSFTCLFLSTPIALVMLILGYTAILAAEYYLSVKNSNTFNRHYFKMRFLLTLIVCLMHAFAFILWL